jgi:hypothetical protein
MYTNRGWIYLKKNKTLLKKKNKFIYVSDDDNIKIKIKDIYLNLIKLKRSSFIEIHELSITDLSHSYDIVSWAMGTHNENIKVYKDEFEISFCEISYLIKYPIWFKIKNIIIEKDINKIKINYDIKDAFLVYLIVNEWIDFYSNKKKIKILFLDKNIDWIIERTLNIENLINIIINNSFCEFELNDEEICYEMLIKYKGKDISSNI